MVICRAEIGHFCMRVNVTWKFEVQEHGGLLGTQALYKAQRQAFYKI